MMFRKFLLFFIVASVSLAGCKSTGKVASDNTRAPQQSTAKHQLSEEELLNLKFIFVNANKEKILGNLDKAAELFSQCIRIDGSNSAAMFELAQIYREQKKGNDALFFARSAAKIDPSNDWYQLFLADLLMDLKKYDESEAVYETLYKSHPGNVDYALKYASALLYNGKVQETIKVYDRVEQEIGVNPDLISEKERLYLRLGKVDKAAEEVEKLIAKDPKEMKYYSMLVELYQSNEMKDKSLESINRMKAVNPQSPYVYLALAEYYRSNNQKDLSFEQLKLAFASKELEIDIKIKIITSYLPLVEGHPDMLEQGLTLSKILSETHPADAISLAIYGNFLEISEKFPDAIQQYRNSVAINNKTFEVWARLFYCESQISDFAGMLKDTEEALTLFPDQSSVYLFNGIALIQEKRYNDAVKSLLSGSKMVVDDDQQLFSFYSYLGEAYNETKDFPSSDKYYEKALKLNPKDAFTLNNYSYYLSVRNENLEKAESMSKLSNDLRPDQSSFQDTYAWILYRMGKYEDAKTWLQKAIDNGGNTSGTILEHMGDVLFKLGDTPKALDFWDKAKKAGGASDLLDKKINDKKLYE